MANTKTIDPDTGLDEIQLEVFERYMAGETLTAIAKDMGLRRETLSRWKNSKTWGEAAQKRTSENIDAVWKRLNKISNKAVDTIEKAIDGKVSKIQFVASESVLDRTLGKAATPIEIADKSEYDLHKRAEEIAAKKANEAAEPEE